MTIHRFSGACALAAVLAGNSLCVAGPVAMTLLRDGVIALSDDGQVAAFQRVQSLPSTTWTASGGFVPIPVPQNFTAVNVNGLSRDGRYVAGSAVTTSSFSAYRYTRSSNTTVLLGPTSPRSVGESVSSSGVVVGRLNSPSRAGAWHEGTGWQSLNTNPNFLFSTATAVSDDGSTIAGYGGTTLSIPARWTAADGPIPLPTLPGTTYAIPQAISADGRTIFGINSSEGVIWRDGQIQQLHVQVLATYQQALRADGRMVGVATAAGASLWEEGVGARLLSDVVASLGFNVNGFRFDSIHGISADGGTLTGIGRTVSGTRVSYLLTNVPTPGTCLAFLTLPLLAGRRRCRA